MAGAAGFPDKYAAKILGLDNPNDFIHKAMEPVRERAEKPGFVMRFTNKDSFGTVATAEFWERPHYAVKGLCPATEP